MSRLEKLDYQTPQRQRRKIRLPEDWRRRLIFATVASAIVFVLTFDAARRSELASPLLDYLEGKLALVQGDRAAARAALERALRSGGLPPAAAEEAGRQLTAAR